MFQFKLITYLELEKVSLSNVLNFALQLRVLIKEFDIGNGTRRPISQTKITRSRYAEPEAFIIDDILPMDPDA